jgi:glycosyltransferase involved in cell wall biosynthesis
MTAVASHPLISVVTISFNQAGFLERAMRSVLEQDYPNIEYIVVDAGSNDGSREIIERYRNRIARVIFEHDNGPADGLNKGFSFATGEIFGYLNADDLFLQHAFSEVAGAFGNSPEVGVVTGHGFLIDAGGKPFRRFRSPPFNAWRFAFGCSNVMQQSTYFRRSVFANSPGFNIHNFTSWDGELMLEFALNGAKFRTLNRYLSAFTIHSNSISGSQRRASQSKENHDRYFKRVMGKDRSDYDEIMHVLAWLDKQIVDPANLFVRLSDRIMGCPNIPPELIPGNQKVQSFLL